MFARPCLNAIVRTNTGGDRVSRSRNHLDDEPVRQHPESAPEKRKGEFGFDSHHVMKQEVARTDQRAKQNSL